MRKSFGLLLFVAAWFGCGSVQADLLKQSTAAHVMVLLIGSSDHVTGLASATLTITASKNGGAFASTTPTVTDRGSGWYDIALSTTDTNTTGPLALHITATSADPLDVLHQVVTFDPYDATRLGLSALPNAAAAASGGLPTVDASNAVKVQSGTGANQISLSSGTVTVGTNSDKTGYSLSQSFPSNFSSLAITAGGTVTVGTNNDKTGYTASTVSDKTGYSLASADSSIVQSGTAQAGAASTITLASGADSATDDIYKGETIKIYSSTGAGQVRRIIGYVASTRVATVDRAWAVNPSSSSLYAVLATSGPKVDANLAATAGTVSDKTGYSLSQAFPSNFSSLAITGGGAVTAGTVSDKTGYSLSQTFPTNFSSLAITVGGAVTVGTNNDKTGYTASTVSDKTGYSIASGGITSSSFGAGAINAAAIATDAIGAAELASDAVSEIQSGLSTLTAANVWDLATTGHTTSGTFGAAAVAAGGAGDPWSTSLPSSYGAGTAGYIVGNNLNATVSSRSTLTAANVWDALLSGITTSSSIGKLIKDDLDTNVGSRMATFSYTAPLSAGATANAVWDEARSSHVTSGTFGQGVASVQGNVTGSTASVTADVGITQVGADKVWGTATRTLTASLDPTAAQIRTEMDSNSTRLAHLDVDTSTRLATASYTAPNNAGITSNSTDLGTLLGRLTVLRSGYLDNLATAPPTTTAIKNAVLDEALSGHTTTGTVGAALTSAASAGDPWAITLPGSYASGTAGNTLGNLRFGLASDLAGAHGAGAWGVSGPVTVGGYSTGQDPATLLLAATVDSTLTVKQVMALANAILVGKYSTSLSGSTRTTTYYRANGTTVLAVSVVSVADPQVRTWTFSNLP